ncbi:MAG TPA: acyclic terpene utilization AtuA family protein [Clostridiales bacterium]|nr:acyclic terpene utilization AtuA family protein [Clostridiales bacterium]
MKTIRIGSGAGYAGDRIEPAVELMEKGNLDYIIFECLAERTIALGQKEKQRDGTKGYNPLLEYRMQHILPLVKEKRIKVVTNMGAANVKAAADKTMEIAKSLGIDGIKIAYVTGDDLGKNLEAFSDHDVLETGCKLKDMGVNIISANAYMGAEGIMEALRNHADVIITGRVSDPALVIGPLAYEFGWDMEKDLDRMGQAVLAGHLLECAGQVTGGYYADPGYKEVPDLERLGYPLAEIDESGTFIITKVEGSGGLVTTDTCKEQMIYEIHNPEEYYTPDAIADFSKVTFTQVGKDRVEAEHAVSKGKPGQLKVSIGYEDCYIGEGEISYGGSNCLERAKLAEEVVRKRLEITSAVLEEYRCDYIGYNSLYRDAISERLCDGNRSEIRLRISGRTKDEWNATLIANEVEALYTNGPAGGGGVVKRVEQVVSVCSIFISREDVTASVDYLEIP